MVSCPLMMRCQTHRRCERVLVITVNRAKQPLTDKLDRITRNGINGIPQRHQRQRQQRQTCWNGSIASPIAPTALRCSIRLSATHPGSVSRLDYRAERKTRGSLRQSRASIRVPIILSVALRGMGCDGEVGTGNSSPHQSVMKSNWHSGGLPKAARFPGSPHPKSSHSFAKTVN